MDLITKLSSELKERISQYEPKSFLGHLVFYHHIHFKQNIKEFWNQESDINLKSPAKQLAYLTALYISGKKGVEIFNFEFADELFNLLNKIEQAYRELFVKDYSGKEITQSELDALVVTSLAFSDYYFSTDLKYYEQELDKISGKYNPIKDQVQSSCGVELNQLIEFFQSNLEVLGFSMNKYYSKIDSFEFKNILKNLESGKDFEDLFNDKKINDSSIESFIDYIENPGLDFHFSTKDLSKFSTLSIDKLNSLMNELSIDILEYTNEEYLYYTDEPITNIKPFIKIDNNNFILVSERLLPLAISNFIDQKLHKIGKTTDQINKLRDKNLERKSIKLLSRFLQNGYSVHSGYYIDSSSEKDLIFISPRNIFIIECKANSLKPRFRNINKSIKRIKNEFKVTVEKGIDQSTEVFDYISLHKEFNIYDKHKNIIGSYSTDDSTQIFQIIITNERYGIVQNDLLRIKNFNTLNQSICSFSIYDLETFLMVISRMNNSIDIFINYLKYRVKLHGRLICNDELDLCGWFLLDPKSFIDGCNSNQVVLPDNTLFQIFDELYYIGFGFKYENHNNKRENKEMDGFKFEKYLNLLGFDQSKLYYKN